MSATVMQIIATIVFVGFFASMIITFVIGIFAAIKAVNKDKDNK